MSSDDLPRRYPFTGIREFFGFTVGEFDGQKDLENIEQDIRNLRPALENLGFESSNKHLLTGRVTRDQAKDHIGKYLISTLKSFCCNS